MITAKEARELSGKTIQELALDFDECIREAAKNKQRFVMKYHGELENEAYGNTERWREFQKYMKSLGYETSLYYSESQFVDMRITISWE